jgi:hypothetical protein
MRQVVKESSVSCGRCASGAKPRLGTLRWWIAGALALHFAAWVAWFTIASRHPVSEVPLATSGRH